MGVDLQLIKKYDAEKHSLSVVSFHIRPYAYLSLGKWMRYLIAEELFGTH